MAVIVKFTDKKGRGVFAERDFKAGEFILPVNGKRYSVEEALSLSEHFLNHMGAVSKDEWIVWGYPERYINHCCNPNVFERNLGIYAMRDIKKGEELSFDYSINGFEVDDWRMTCHCGSDGCRKLIKGDFFLLSEELQKKYLPFLDDWFAKEFEHRLDKIKPE